MTGENIIIMNVSKFGLYIKKKNSIKILSIEHGGAIK